jgi:hypothetical protein
MYVYIPDGTSSQWVQVATAPQGPTGPTGPTGPELDVSTITLDDFENVSFTNLQGGDLLAYDSDISTWVNVSSLDGGTP